LVCGGGGGGGGGGVGVGVRGVGGGGGGGGAVSKLCDEQITHSEDSYCVCV
jgi:hypothetical protein